MAEQKMTYLERRMKLAFEFDDMENADEYDAAAFTIKKQEEAIREILNVFFDPAIIDFDRVLLEHGYIEPKTEDDGK